MSYKSRELLDVDSLAAKTLLHRFKFAAHIRPVVLKVVAKELFIECMTLA